MSVVTRAGAMPFRIQIMLECLSAAEGRKLPRKELEALLAPRTLRDAASPPSGEVSRTFDDVFSEARSLGLVQETKSIVSPTEAFLSKWKPGQDIGAVVRNCLEAAILGVGDGPPLPEQRNVGLALAWLIECRGHQSLRANDILGFPIASECPGFKPDGNGYALEMTNNTRNSNLFYWGMYFGLIQRTPLEGRTMGFEPFPLDALRRALPGMFGKKKELSAGHFKECLGKACPALDGGALHEQVVHALPEERRRDSGRLSGSVSAALSVLKAQGVISLSSESDSKSTLELTPLGDGRAETFNQVTVLAEGA